MVEKSLRVPSKTNVRRGTAGIGESPVVKKTISPSNVSWRIKYKGVPVIGGGPITEKFPGIYKTVEEIDESLPISTNKDILQEGENGALTVGGVSVVSIVLVVLAIGLVIYFIKGKGK